jgi:phage terminase large subunit-like protein
MAVRGQMSKHNPKIALIEDKASGTQLIQELRSEGLYKVMVYAAPPGADKIIRLHAQTALFEGGDPSMDI